MEFEWDKQKRIQSPSTVSTFATCPAFATPNYSAFDASGNHLDCYLYGSNGEDEGR